MKPLVAILMGSKSDWEVMSHASQTLDKLKVPHDVRVLSAHRTPDALFEYIAAAEAKGVEVFIAAAGGAAHLAGRRADLPPELLERLAGDRHPAVRAAAAAAPRQSDEMLTRLAFDRDEGVRLAVLRNRGAPPTALDALAASASAEIRLLVAAHPRASEPVLQRLRDGSGDAAERIAQDRLRGGSR